MYEKSLKTWLKHIDFMILDLLFMEVSFLFAHVLRHNVDVLFHFFDNTRFTELYRNAVLIIALLHMVYVLIAEPYAHILRRNAIEELKSVVLYGVYMLGGTVLVLFLFKSSGIISRSVVFGFAVIAIVLVYTYRSLYKWFLRKHITKAENQSRLLLIAPYHEIEEIVRAFYQNKVSPVKIVGIILTDSQAESEVAATRDSQVSKLSKEKKMERFWMQDIPIVGGLEDMYEYARTNVVDEVLICMDNEDLEQMVNAFISMGITVHISIWNLIKISKAVVNRVNGISVITSYVSTMTSGQLIIKRMIDIFFGLLGSVVTVLLTVFLAPIIWIADPGPIFFAQERVGRNGRSFKLWKFRTMYMGADERKAEFLEHNKMNGLMFKMDDDPRIIGCGKKFSIGKFLRETSIDELPQSFNILAGSMSVVGTRPPTVDEYRQYELHHKGRLAIKPGLTGMWQVSGRSDITDFEEVVQLDKEYIDQFSLLLDLKIMLKTIKVVLGKKGSL